MALSTVGSALSFYIHIPYCIKRCGYCDFNTYTPAELKIESTLTQISHDYIDLMIEEIEMARRACVVGDSATMTNVPSIFFGGGTPTLMEPEDLARVIQAIEANFGLTADCEITMEANPDTVTAERLDGYRIAGFNRLSIGMQSAVPHVLQTLDRTHNPENVERTVAWARGAGFEEISLDLIYGTPGESLADWQQSIDSALALDITHISAYALIVEQGTKLSAQVRRGEVAMPDDDETADKYIIADESFRAAGFTWYEISNWAKPGSECRHNLSYWQGANWWGVGPGAHSHLDGRRWWNVKHPTAYRERIMAKVAPMQEQELLSAAERAREEIMLLIRLPSALQLELLSDGQRELLTTFLMQGYLDQSSWDAGSITLTQSGRLIADRIVREITL